MLKLYHGSIKQLEIGLILEKQKNSYVDYEEVISLENAFEYFKPENKISRKQAVFSVDNPENLDNVGAYTDYIYEVVIFDKAEKSDLTWYTKANMEMGDFFEIEEITDKAKEYIKNYWEGITSNNPVWEYRSEIAKINKELNDNDLILIEKKNKKSKLTIKLT